MYASRVVSFYIFKENSFCTWHFISFWSSYPYLTPVLLSPFFFCYFNIQNSYTEWSSNEYYNSNYVRKLKRFHFVFSFVILCFVYFYRCCYWWSLYFLEEKKNISSPQTSCFLWADLRDPAPFPPKTRKLALFVCCLLFVVVERSDEFQVRSVIVVLLESL